MPQMHGKGELWSAEMSLEGADMSCRDTIHLICWYLEGKLSPSVETQIQQHLSQCRDCRMVLDAANTTLDRYFGSSQSPEIDSSSHAA